MSFTTNSERFFNGIHLGLSFAPHMGAVDAAVLRGYLRELDQFICFGVVAGGINQGGGEPEGAVLHGLSKQSLHLLKLFRCWSAVDIPQNRLTDLRGTHVGANVEWRDALLESCEASVQAGPIHLQMI